MELGKYISNISTCWEVYDIIRKETNKNSDEFQLVLKLREKLTEYNLIVWI